MSTPTVITIHHSLGREEAKRRIAARIGELGQHLPGGVAQVDSSWTAEDRMAVRVAAMGQTVDAALTVEDAAVQVALTLPPMLSFFRDKIATLVERRGGELLLEDRR